MKPYLLTITLGVAITVLQYLVFPFSFLPSSQYIYLQLVKLILILYLTKILHVIHYQVKYFSLKKMFSFLLLSLFLLKFYSKFLKLWILFSHTIKHRALLFHFYLFLETFFSEPPVLFFYSALTAVKASSTTVIMENFTFLWIPFCWITCPFLFWFTKKKSSKVS